MSHVLNDLSLVKGILDELYLELSDEEELEEMSEELKDEIGSYIEEIISIAEEIKSRLESEMT